MKKNYQKPDIFFEDFAFSSNIAAGCGVADKVHDSVCQYNANHGNPDDCHFYDNGAKLFLESGSCLSTPVDGMFGNLCYHTAGEDSRIFNS